MRTTQNHKKTFKNIKPQILAGAFIIFIILLTALNINSYFSPDTTKVLGAETEISSEEFWTEFLTDNSNYIPGWIEIGRLDKASQIDPNYFLK